MIEEERFEVDDHADLDKYIGAQLLLDVGGDTLTGRVIKRARGSNGARVSRPQFMHRLEELWTNTWQMSLLKTCTHKSMVKDDIMISCKRSLSTNETIAPLPGPMAS